MAKLVWKIVIIGDPAVGKTSIRRKYLGETTLKEYIYTIGADFATKRIKLTNNLTVQYQIFDLAGQQKFDKVRSSFYSGAQAAILVYDITNANSLVNLPKWVREAKQNNDGSLETFVVVGNKIDLRDQKKTNDAILKKFLKDLSRTMGHEILHIFTSALTGENIELLFKKVTEILLTKASKNNPQIERLAKPILKETKSDKEKTPEQPPKLKIPEPKAEPADPLEKRLKHIELEIDHLQMQVTELYEDMKYVKDLLLKYLHQHKKILEELKLQGE
ncbi:MAG: Rab family GTPase [Candidatus Heimdallarchaeota archaeon]|nr:GTP-binding protein [Candidatus Heimdallarchaeota archaeon]